ncbi:MAG TPA: SURF1 family protein [Burkholderiales bacterium]|nr:SURF1 family protein [Burkholderiales bacterium]
MTRRFDLRIGWVPSLAMLAVVGLCVALGVWQLDRAAQKRALQTRFEQLARDNVIEVPAAPLDAKDVELRQVSAHGAFEPRNMIFIDNRVLHGVVGYYVIMPLRLGTSDRYVLVNRGWVAGTSDRSRLPEIRTPPGAIAVTGVAEVPGKRIFELSQQVMEGRVWQNLTIDRYRQAFPIAIQPFVIRQSNDLHDGLVREWEPPDFGIERHYGYAVQWFLLGATAVVFYGVAYARRARKR